MKTNVLTVLSSRQSFVKITNLPLDITVVVISVESPPGVKLKHHHGVGRVAEMERQPLNTRNKTEAAGGQLSKYM